MSTHLPGKHYGRAFQSFLWVWIVLGSTSLAAGCWLAILDDRFALLAVLCFAWFAIFTYTVPSVLACGRSHPNRWPIYAVNLFMGWTLIGWVVALALSLTQMGAHDSAMRSHPC